MEDTTRKYTVDEAVAIYKNSLLSDNKDREYLKVKISTAGEGKPFIKQLQSFNSLWGNCKFYINENIPECDLWVIYGGLKEKESVSVPSDMVLFITTEPETVHRYNKKFLQQFSSVLTSQESIQHPHTIHQQQALPWWVGYTINTEDTTYNKTYTELKNSTTPQKEKLASIIVSNKTFTPGHKKRYAFAQKLKKELGSEIDFYGIGENIINDKWDAIAPYKYHITLENNSTKNYFTEKLSDTFLAESYPLYYGCTNIYDYFPVGSLTTIDIEKEDIAIEKIRSILHSDTYEKSINSLYTAKNLILDTYQIFPMIHAYILEHHTQKEKIIITLTPEKESIVFSFLRKIKKYIQI